MARAWWKIAGTIGPRLRRALWRGRGARISGFGGPYRFKCNEPSRLHLEDCLLEEGLDIKIGTAPDAEVVVGRGAWIGRNTTINVVAGCEIGQGAMVAANCYLCDFAHGMERGAPMMTQPLKPVGPELRLTVGRDVWVGANSVIVGRVRIGEGAVIGALSLVRCSVPPFEIWAGVPARKIGERR